MSEEKMNQITITCPHCNAQLEAPAEWSGLTVECPACHKNFTVQPAVQPLAVPTPVPTPEKTLSSPGRPCPYCGGLIKESAKLCKHCKKDLTQHQPEEEKKFIFICPECDTPAELPESMQGKEYECTSCCETTIATPAEERKCPKCGGSVKIKATVCKHCKTPLQALLIPGKKIVLQPARQNTAPKLSAAYNTMPASPQGVLTPQILANKSFNGLLLWNLLFPGAGHIYLGMTKLGIIFALLFILSVIVFGGLSLLLGLFGIGITVTYAFIAGDSFNIMTALYAGESVSTSVPRAKAKQYLELLPPEIKKNNKTCSILLLICLLLGLHVPGILGWICFIVGICAR